jgi:hypothetical protein
MGSKQQTILFNKLTKLCPKLFFHSDFRPDFLKNVETGNNLEIDIWNSKFKIGFEFQGGVHFKHIGKYKNDPDKSRKHDLKKYDLINKKHLKATIIEIFETDLNGDDFRGILTQRLVNTLIYYNSDPKRHKYKIKTLKKFIKYINDDFIK